MARDLAGKHIVIVGASGVLGGEIAKELIKDGAIVSAIVRDPSRISVAGITRSASADISDSQSLVAAMAALAPFDGLVNAAGVVAFGNLKDVTDQSLAQLFAINTIAPITMLRECALHMGDGGFFLNISAVVAQAPMAGMAAYSASKAGVWGAMVAGTRELRRQGIDVIDARPPHTETGLASRPIAGTAPHLPEGLDPTFVASKIVTGIKEGVKDMPVEFFAHTS